LKIDFAEVRKCLKAFDFPTLFRTQLGWDNHHGKLDIALNGTTYSLTAVAEKRGFVAYVCPSIPDRAIRLKLDHQVTKSSREHFIVYADKNAGQQVWQWVRREPGKPMASRDHRFDAKQSGDPLIQRLEQIAVALDEEEKITVVDVAGRARAAFDVEKVTKQFYERFKAEHASFQKFIEGIKDDADLQWYTSLMLNRLMFVYFIQKKGFLDGDHDYLRNRMKLMQQQRGKDKFITFYRYFLLRLFHEGLGLAPKDRDAALDKLLGKVPYLNGGFFEVHQLEERYKEIEIPDKAFEKLFTFFDQYNWHLDERPLRKDNEINPDVVGYIFEKYINQKQMGAYYTKEDITEYIGKNCIIPFLFDAAEKKCPIAFKPDSFLWRLLKDDPDRYIFPAVGHGITCDYHDKDKTRLDKPLALPAEIEQGIKDVSKRGGWNKPAPEEFALPTETWREVVARRTRCLELREKLKSGQIQNINDLITLNLDLWQFARDVIINSEGPELLRAFWQAILKLTVLDPTCGSGAFLFAALRILETLYSDCLERMERFLEDLAGKEHHPEKFKDFKDILEQIAKHPNEKYFIFKSIIINNLFGVDIMEEAVEICKLRLFLKLVSQVEKADEIEPLPDIDFNIRAGNTLVGFATRDQVRKSMEGTLGFAEKQVEKINEDALAVECIFKLFREQQTKHGGRVTAKDKLELRKRLAALDLELDRYLAGEYGVDPKKAELFEKWRKSHQPFHWFVEFYGIMHDGGFDAIIGNPPYVEYRKVKATYQIRDSNYSSTPAQNLYAFCTERSGQLLRVGGRFGMIIPSSAVGLDETACLRAVLRSKYSGLYYSTYSIRPAKLFDGVDQRLCIVIGDGTAQRQQTLFATAYRHWSAEERPFLFATLQYAASFVHPRLNRIAQIGDQLERQILEKIELRSKSDAQSYYAVGNRGFVAHYHRSPRYWIRAMDFEQYFKSDTRSRSVHHFRDLLFKDEAGGKCVCAIINSSLYFFWFMAVCNGRNLTAVDVERFPVGEFDAHNKKRVGELFDRLMKDYKKNSFVRERTDCKFQEFRPSISKPIIDEIDRALGKHYGLSDAEVDHILNYDTKYRVGADAGDEEGDDE
jgi:hypothetical protein